MFTRLQCSLKFQLKLFVTGQRESRPEKGKSESASVSSDDDLNSSSAGSDINNDDPLNSFSSDTIDDDDPNSQSSLETL